MSRLIRMASIAVALAGVAACSEDAPGNRSAGSGGASAYPRNTTGGQGAPVAGNGNAAGGRDARAAGGPGRELPVPAATGAGGTLATAAGGAADSSPSSIVPPPSTKDGGADSADAAPTSRRKNCLQPGNGNYLAPGPYAVAKVDVDLGTIATGQHTGKFTIYYPKSMETNCPHPIVAWANGTGVTDSDVTYDFLNSAAASWGMVVASSAEDNAGSGLFHEAGIDYLLRQNDVPTSVFFHKMSSRAGVAGHDAGGYGANLASSHPKVEALAVEGAGVVPDMKVAGLILTGTDDLVTGAGHLAQTAAGPMFVAVWRGGNHIGTETVLGYSGQDTTSGDAANSQRGSVQFQRLYAAWFRCFLADDDVACKLFTGGTPTGCGICKDPGWDTLASKNL